MNHPNMTPTLQRFASAVQRQLEAYGWTVNATWGDGYFAHLAHVECVHDDQHHGWGLLLPEIAWREAYKALVQPRTGLDWFDLWTQCEQGDVPAPAPSDYVDPFACGSVFSPDADDLSESVTVKAATTPPSRHDTAVGALCVRSMFADWAVPVPLTITNEDDLLASLETGLANEVRDLASVLLEFSRRAQLIGKELPDTAYWGKSITSLLGLLGLQLSYALIKDSDTPLLVNDGAQYLSKLGLSLQDAVREISLDGRRFLAVALPDGSKDQVFDHAQVH